MIDTINIITMEDNIFVFSLFLFHYLKHKPNRFNCYYYWLFFSPKKCFLLDRITLANRIETLFSVNNVKAFVKNINLVLQLCGCYQFLLNVNQRS